MKDKTAIRQAFGERLRQFREKRGLTIYDVAMAGGIRHDQAKAVETGEKNYTIDAFLGYIHGSDLYMFFAEKSEHSDTPHDFTDLVKKLEENDQNL